MRALRLALLLLSLFAPTRLRAQNATAVAPSAGAMAAAAQLLALMNLESVMRASTSAMLAAQVKQQPAMAPFRDVMQAWADSIMTLKAMAPALNRVYAETFSEGELRQLIAFYQTPIGRKLAAVTPALSRRGAEVGSEIAEANLPMLQAMIQARAAELQRPPER